MLSNGLAVPFPYDRRVATPLDDCFAYTWGMLPDYLAPGLKVVFVGTAAGERSAFLGHYYSGRGNKFWELLWETGLTGDRVLSPEQDDHVLSYGVGLTDIAKAVAASSDTNLRAGDLDIPGFLVKIERYEPTCVTFNGKGAAAKVAAHLGHAKPDHGPTGFGIAGAVGYVLPSSSGSNNDPVRFRPKNSKADWWREFGEWLGHAS
jgi:TDG/mug DNA glycosylase family protein